ncbi:chronophin [Drosophila ficusphila]|uniref:chronophin n=1 Tax=Drosophila ficusphila TaxID=30025 RepID=UPI0007E8B13A|nr:chronophin [Drosophila ficusphila]
MFKRSLSHLDKLPKSQVAEWLAGIDTIICSTDGVLWQENNPIEGSAEVINTIQAKGKRSLMISNDCSLTTSGLIEKAKCMGFELKEQDMLSSAGSISSYLTERNFKKKVFVLGGDGISKELKTAGFCSEVNSQRWDGQPKFDFLKSLELDPDVGAVLVSRGDTTDSHQLLVACNFLMNPKILFLATCTDGFLPFGERRIPDAGALAAAIEVIVKRKPTLLGKPNPRILGKLLESGEIKPEKTLMIGNSLKSDILFADICGFQSLLVGKDNGAVEQAEKIKEEGDEKKMKCVPDTYLPSLEPFLEFLNTDVKSEKKNDENADESKECPTETQKQQENK